MEQVVRQPEVAPFGLRPGLQGAVCLGTVRGKYGKFKAVQHPAPR